MNRQAGAFRTVLLACLVAGAVVTGAGAATAVPAEPLDASADPIVDAPVDAAGVRTIPLDAPGGMAVSKDGATGYVGTGGVTTAALTVLSLPEGTVEATIDLTPYTNGAVSTAGAPAGVVLSPDGNKAYVALSGRRNGPGTSFVSGVVVVDTAARTVDTATPFIAGKGYPSALTVSRDGSKVYVPAQSATGLTPLLSVQVIDTGAGTGSLLGQLFDFNSYSTGALQVMSPVDDMMFTATNSGVSAFDPATDTATGTIAGPPAGVGTQLAISPDGGTLIYAETGTSVYASNAPARLWRIDPATQTQTGGPLTTGTGSVDWTNAGMAFSPDGTNLYARSSGGSVVRVDPATMTVTRRLGGALPASKQFVTAGDRLYAVTNAGLALFEPPKITNPTSDTPSRGKIGTQYAGFTVTATGAGKLGFTATGLPTGLSIDNDGLISGTPTGPAGSYPVTVTASGFMDPAATRTFTIDIDAAGVAPQVTSADHTTGQAGKPLTEFTYAASGTPATMTWSTPGATTGAVAPGTDRIPKGLTLDGAAGTLSGTIDPSVAPGDYAFTVQAENGVPPAGTQTFTVTVTAAGVAPTVSNPADQRVAVGGTATFTVQTTGVPAPTVTWEVSTDGGKTWQDSTADPAAKLSGDGLTLTVTDAPAGHDGYQYRATATNSQGAQTSGSAKLTVADSHGSDSTSDAKGSDSDSAAKGSGSDSAAKGSGSDSDSDSDSSSSGSTAGSATRANGSTDGSSGSGVGGNAKGNDSLATTGAGSILPFAITGGIILLLAGAVVVTVRVRARRGSVAE